MDGEPVRFYLSDATLATTPLALTFYTLDGNLRELDTDTEEVFYLHTLGWVMGASAGTLFDDANDDDSADTGEEIWSFGSGNVSSTHFGRPVPMKNPKILTASDVACIFVGHGFIRGK